MKNFSLKTKVNFRRSSSRPRVLKILLIFIAAIGALYFIGSFIGKAGAIVSMPVFAVREWFFESSATLPSYLRSRTELLQEMHLLEEALKTESGKNATIVRLTKENEELRALIGYENESKILASVIARPPNLPYDALLIDRGTRAGVHEGAIVYFARDQAIGYVSRTFGRSALVTLFSTPGVKATAYILGPDIYATLEGQGGGVVRLSVPQGIELKKRDVVVLPSLSGAVVGTIAEVESSPTQPVQYGYALSEAPIQSLNLVSVDTEVPDVITFEEAEAILRDLKTERLRIDLPEELLVDGTYASSTTATSTTPAVSDE